MTTSGFTLVEILVVVTIISITSALLLVGWPTIRTEQAFTLSTAQVGSLLHEAEQRALNQQQADPVGIAINGNQVYLFVDANGNKQYDAHEEVEQQTLPGGVASAVGGWQSWVFMSAPPTMYFFGPGGKPLAGADESRLVLVQGAATRTLIIQAFGQLHVAP